jgi:hypothetical protein
MKYTFILLLLITLYGCDTKTQKPDESLPTFTITNDFRYNKPISSYTAKNGILKDSVGLSFKQLPIKNAEEQYISCRYKLLGGRSYAVDPDGNDHRDDLIRQVECTFGILDTSSGFEWKTEFVSEEDILPLLSMNFEIIPEEERFYTDTSHRSIIGLNRALIKEMTEEMNLKKKFKNRYVGSEEEREDIRKMESEKNKTFAISAGNTIVSTLLFSEKPKKGQCVGVTYNSYRDFIKQTSLTWAIYSMRIYRLNKEYGL